MEHYCEQNVSCTISYDPHEVPQIVKWIDKHWDEYCGVSFLYRDDPTKSAEALGYSYLPQEVISAEAYHAYVGTLKKVEYVDDVYDLSEDKECKSGACPAR